MDSPEQVIQQIAQQLLRLLNYRLVDSQLEEIPTYELIELFLRNKNRYQLYCTVPENGTPEFSFDMTEEATSVCSKKFKMDVFSSKNPLQQLQFTLIKPDIKFNLKILNKVKPFSDISQRIATNRLLSYQLLINPQGEFSFYIVLSQINVIMEVGVNKIEVNSTDEAPIMATELNSLLDPKEYNYYVQQKAMLRTIIQILMYHRQLYEFKQNVISNIRTDTLDDEQKKLLEISVNYFEQLFETIEANIPFLHEVYKQFEKLAMQCLISEEDDGKMLSYIRDSNILLTNIQQIFQGYNYIQVLENEIILHQLNIISFDNKLVNNPNEYIKELNRLEKLSRLVLRTLKTKEQTPSYLNDFIAQIVRIQKLACIQQKYKKLLDNIQKFPTDKIFTMIQIFSNHILDVMSTILRKQQKQLLYIVDTRDIAVQIDSNILDYKRVTVQSQYKSIWPKTVISQQQDLWKMSLCFQNQLSKIEALERKIIDEVKILMLDKLTMNLPVSNNFSYEQFLILTETFSDFFEQDTNKYDNSGEQERISIIYTLSYNQLAARMKDLQKQINLVLHGGSQTSFNHIQNQVEQIMFFKRHIKDCKRLIRLSEKICTDLVAGQQRELEQLSDNLNKIVTTTLLDRVNNKINSYKKKLQAQLNMYSNALLGNRNAIQYFLSINEQLFRTFMVEFQLNGTRKPEIRKNEAFAIILYNQQILNVMLHCPSHKISHGIRYANLKEHEQHIMGVYAIVNTMTKQSQNKHIEQMIIQIGEAISKLFNKINLNEIDDIYNLLVAKQDNKYEQVLTYYNIFQKYAEPINIPGMEIIFSIETMPPQIKSGRVNKITDIFQTLELYIVGIQKRVSQLATNIQAIFQGISIDTQEYMDFINNMKIRIKRFQTIQTHLCLIITGLVTCKYCTGLTYIEVKFEQGSITFQPDISPQNIAVRQVIDLLNNHSIVQEQKVLLKSQSQQYQVYNWINQMLNLSTNQFQSNQWTNINEIKIMQSIIVRIILLLLMCYDVQSIIFFQTKKQINSGTKSGRESAISEQIIIQEIDTISSFLERYQLLQEGPFEFVLQMVSRNMNKLYDISLEIRKSIQEQNGIQSKYNSQISNEQQFKFTKIRQLKKVIGFKPLEECQEFILENSLCKQNIAILHQIFNYQMNTEVRQSFNKQFGMFIFNVDALVAGQEEMYINQQLFSSLQTYEKEISIIHNFLLEQVTNLAKTQQRYYEFCFSQGQIDDKRRLQNVHRLVIQNYKTQQDMIILNRMNEQLSHALIIINSIHSATFFSLTAFAVQRKQLEGIMSKTEELIHLSSNELFNHICAELQKMFNSDIKVQKYVNIIFELLGLPSEIESIYYTPKLEKTSTITMMLLDCQSELNQHHRSILDYIRAKILLQNKKSLMMKELDDMVDKYLVQRNYFDIHEEISNLIQFFINLEALLLYISQVAVTPLNEYYKSQHKIIKKLQDDTNTLQSYDVKIEELKPLQTSLLIQLKTQYLDLLILLQKLQDLDSADWKKLIDQNNVREQPINFFINLKLVSQNADVLAKANKIKSDKEIKYNLQQIIKNISKYTQSDIVLDIHGLLASNLLRNKNDEDLFIQDWYEHELIKYIHKPQNIIDGIQYIYNNARYNIEVLEEQITTSQIIVQRVVDLIQKKASMIIKQQINVILHCIPNNIIKELQQKRKNETGVEVDSDDYEIGDEFKIHELLDIRDKLNNELLLGLIPTFPMVDKPIQRSEIFKIVSHYINCMAKNDLLINVVSKYEGSPQHVFVNIISNDSPLNRVVLGVDKVVINSKNQVVGYVRNGKKYNLWVFYTIDLEAFPVLFKYSSYTDHYYQIKMTLQYTEKNHFLKTVINLRKIFQAQFSFNSPFMNFLFSESELLEYLIDTEDNYVDEKNIIIAMKIILDAILLYSDQNITVKRMIQQFQSYQQKIIHILNGFACVVSDEKYYLLQILQQNQHILTYVKHMQQILHVYLTKLQMFDDKIPMSTIISRLGQFLVINQEYAIYISNNEANKNLYKNSFDIVPTNECILQVRIDEHIEIKTLEEFILIAEDLKRQYQQQHFKDVFLYNLIKIYISDSLSTDDFKRLEKNQSYEKCIQDMDNDNSEQTHKILYQLQYDGNVFNNQFLDAAMQLRIVDKQAYQADENRRRLVSRLRFLPLDKAGKQLANGMIYHSPQERQRMLESAAGYMGKLSCLSAECDQNIEVEYEKSCLDTSTKGSYISESAPNVSPHILLRYNETILEFMEKSYGGSLQDFVHIQYSQFSDELPSLQAFKSNIDVPTHLEMLLQTYQSNVKFVLNNIANYIDTILDCKLFSYICIEKLSLKRNLIEILAKLWYFIRYKQRIHGKVIVQRDLAYSNVTTMILQCIYIITNNIQYLDKEAYDFMLDNKIIITPCTEMCYQIMEKIEQTESHEQCYFTININEMLDVIKIQQFVQLEQFLLQHRLMLVVLPHCKEIQLIQKIIKASQEIISMVQQIYQDYSQLYKNYEAHELNQIRLFMYYCYGEYIDIFEGIINLLGKVNCIYKVNYQQFKKIFLFISIQTYGHFDFQNKEFINEQLQAGVLNEYPRFLHCKFVLQEDMQMEDKFAVNNWVQYLVQQLTIKFKDFLSNQNIFSIKLQFESKRNELEVRYVFQNQLQQNVRDYPEFICALLKLQSKRNVIYISKQFQYTEFQEQLRLIAGNTNFFFNVTNYLINQLFVNQKQLQSDSQEQHINLYSNVIIRQNLLLHNLAQIVFYRVNKNSSVQLINQQFDYEQFYITNERANARQFRYINFLIDERTFINKKQYYYSQFMRIFQNFLQNEVMKTFQQQYYKLIFDNLLKVNEQLITKFHSIFLWFVVLSNKNIEQQNLQMYVTLSYILTNHGVPNYKYNHILQALKKGYIKPNLGLYSTSQQNTLQNSSMNDSYCISPSQGISRSATKSILHTVNTLSNLAVNKALYRQILVQSYDEKIIEPENSNFVKGEPESIAIQQIFTENITSQKTQLYELNDAAKTSLHLNIENFSSSSPQQYHFNLHLIDVDELDHLEYIDQRISNYLFDRRLVIEPMYQQKFNQIDIAHGNPFCNTFIVLQNRFYDCLHYLCAKSLQLQYRNVNKINYSANSNFNQTILVSLLLSIQYKQPIKIIIDQQYLTSYIITVIKELAINNFSETMINDVDKFVLLEFVKLANQLLQNKFIRNIYQILLDKSIPYCKILVRPTQLLQIYITQYKNQIIDNQIQSIMKDLMLHSIYFDTTEKLTYLFYQNYCDKIISRIQLRLQALEDQYDNFQIQQYQNSNLFKQNFTHIIRDNIQSLIDDDQIYFLQQLQSLIDKTYFYNLFRNRDNNKEINQCKTELEMQLSDLQKQNDRGLKQQTLGKNNDEIIVCGQQIQKLEIDIKKQNLDIFHKNEKIYEIIEIQQKIQSKINKIQTPKVQKFTKAIQFICQKLISQDYVTYQSTFSQNQLNGLIGLTILRILKTSKRKQVQQYLGDVSIDNFRRKMKVLERLLIELQGLDINHLIESSEYIKIAGFKQKILQIFQIQTKDKLKFIKDVYIPQDPRKFTIVYTPLGEQLRAKLTEQNICQIEMYLIDIIILFLQYAHTQKKINANNALYQDYQNQHQKHQNEVQQMQDQISSNNSKIKQINKQIQSMNEQNQQIKQYLNENQQKFIQMQKQQSNIEYKLKNIAQRVNIFQFIHFDTLALWFHFVMYYILEDKKDLNIEQFEQQFLTHQNSQFFYQTNKAKELVIITYLGQQYIEKILLAALKKEFIVLNNVTYGEYYQILNDSSTNDAEKLLQYYKSGYNLLNEIILEQFNFIPPKFVLLINYLQNSQNGIVIKGSIETLSIISQIIIEFLIPEQYKNNQAVINHLQQINAIHNISDYIKTFEQISLSDSSQTTQTPIKEEHDLQILESVSGEDHQLAIQLDDLQPFIASETDQSSLHLASNQLDPALDKKPDIITTQTINQKSDFFLPIIVRGTMEDAYYLEALINNNYLRKKDNDQYVFLYHYGHEQLRIENFGKQTYKTLKSKYCIKVIFLLDQETNKSIDQAQIQFDELNFKQKEQRSYNIDDCITVDFSNIQLFGYNYNASLGQFDLAISRKYKTISLEDAETEPEPSQQVQQTDNLIAFESSQSAKSGSDKKTTENDDEQDHSLKHVVNNMKILADQEINITPDQDMANLLIQSAEMPIWQDPTVGYEQATDLLLNIKRSITGMQIKTE